MASNYEQHLCVIIIQSYPNRTIPPSESDLKCVEKHIRKEASIIGGFEEKTFNIRFIEKYKTYNCFVNFATTKQAIKASEFFNKRENNKIHGCLLKCKYREPDNNSEPEIKIKPVKSQEL